MRRILFVRRCDVQPKETCRKRKFNPRIEKKPVVERVCKSRLKLSKAVK